MTVRRCFLCRSRDQDSGESVISQGENLSVAQGSHARTNRWDEESRFPQHPASAPQSGQEGGGSCVRKGRGETGQREQRAGGTRGRERKPALPHGPQLTVTCLEKVSVWVPSRPGCPAGQVRSQHPLSGKNREELRYRRLLPSAGICFSQRCPVFPGHRGCGTRQGEGLPAAEMEPRVVFRVPSSSCGQS